MKNSTLCLISAIILCAPFIASAQTNGDTLYWSQDHKLTWNDFKKEPDSIGSAYAVTYSYIGFYMTMCNRDTAELYVFSYFLKNESWEADTSKYGLKHEQGHFNISEIVARRFRKALLELKTNYFKLHDIYDLFFRYSAILDDEQTLYDKETLNSTSEDEQAKWDLRIDKELKEWEDYKNPVVIIKLQAK